MSTSGGGLKGKWWLCLGSIRSSACGGLSKRVDTDVEYWHVQSKRAEQKSCIEGEDPERDCRCPAVARK